MAKGATWPWIVAAALGGLAFGVRKAFAMRTQATLAPPQPTSVPPVNPVAAPAIAPTGQLAGSWVWPVQSWRIGANVIHPVISDGFDSPRPGLPRHGGVDVMFPRPPLDKQPGAAHFVVTPGTFVLAASDGVIWSADRSPRGLQIVVDHGQGPSPRKVATYYAHLDSFARPWKKGDVVHAGEALGTVGADPLDGEHLRHLHFEVWLGGPSDRIDPEHIMQGWEYR